MRETTSASSSLRPLSRFVDRILFLIQGEFSNWVWTTKSEDIKVPKMLEEVSSPKLMKLKPNYWIFESCSFVTPFDSVANKEQILGSNDIRQT